MLALAASLCLLQAAPEPPLLTIGDPAPKLAPLTFVRGESVAGFAPGIITLVEFSGTQCGPCVKAIPHLNALQKKYPAVVVLSIFGEPEADVRAYLDGPGKATEARVATDPTGATLTAWMRAAAQDGIPTCFLVGKDGKLAWIGHPNDLDIPLAKLVAGTFDVQQELLIRRVEEGAQRRRDALRAREKAAEAERERIRELVQAGRPDEALLANEKAIAEYRDLPKLALRFRISRVGCLAQLSERRDEAFEAGAELAIEATAGGREQDMVNVAKALQITASVTQLAARDLRLLDLSLPLLRDAYSNDPDWRRKSADDKLFSRAVAIKFRARAYGLRGDAESARECCRKGVELLEAAPASVPRRAELLAEFRAGLAAPDGTPFTP